MKVEIQKTEVNQYVIRVTDHRLELEFLNLKPLHHRACLDFYWEKLQSQHSECFMKNLYLV